VKILLAIATLMTATTASGACPALLDHTVKDIVGDTENLCQYAGKVVLVVNTASYCGYTPQYQGLEALQKFPMFAKTAVKEAGGSALFDSLAQATGERPKWNFHKYLIGRDGRAAASFASKVEPESPELVGKVEELLGK
jgi:glutathione peroxidase